MLMAQNQNENIFLGGKTTEVENILCMHGVNKKCLFY